MTRRHIPREDLPKTRTQKRAPGKQIGPTEAPPITPDAIIYLDEDTNKYEIEMTNDAVPNLTVSNMWRKYLKEKKGDKTTREFISSNVRNARWLIESSIATSEPPSR